MSRALLQRGAVRTLVDLDAQADGGDLQRAFGSFSADTLHTGTPLTPNLAPGYQPTSGAIINGSGQGDGIAHLQRMDLPEVVVHAPVVGRSVTVTNPGSASGGYTAVTDDLYYSGGHLGTLKIPAIGLSVKIYQGTDSAALKGGCHQCGGNALFHAGHTFFLLYSVFFGAFASNTISEVAVEQVLTFWVAVAKGAGTAEITASNSAGECGSMTLTVGSAAPAAPEAPASMDSASLTDNLEIRQEMIRLINQTRKANGVSELPVSEALM